MLLEGPIVPPIAKRTEKPTQTKRAVKRPLTIEQMDATDYDLVISCSHCVAKGVVRSPRSAWLPSESLR